MRRIGRQPVDRQDAGGVDRATLCDPRERIAVQTHLAGTSRIRQPVRRARSAAKLSPIGKPTNTAITYGPQESSYKSGPSFVLLSIVESISITGYRRSYEVSEKSFCGADPAQTSVARCRAPGRAHTSMARSAKSIVCQCSRRAFLLKGKQCEKTGILARVAIPTRCRPTGRDLPRGVLHSPFRARGSRSQIGGAGSENCCDESVPTVSFLYPRPPSLPCAPCLRRRPPPSMRRPDRYYCSRPRTRN